MIALPAASRRLCDAIPTRQRRSALRLAAGLGDREFFELVPGLHICAQPARGCAAAGPGFFVVLRIAILGGDLATFELAAARFPSAFCAAARPQAEAVERRKLCLELAPRQLRFARDHTNDIVA